MLNTAVSHCLPFPSFQTSINNLDKLDVLSKHVFLAVASTPVQMNESDLLLSLNILKKKKKKKKVHPSFFILKKGFLSLINTSVYFILFYFCRTWNLVTLLWTRTVNWRYFGFFWKQSKRRASKWKCVPALHIWIYILLNSPFKPSCKWSKLKALKKLDKK